MKFGLLTRRFCTTRKINPKICIVGAGPAGFYAADFLARRINNAQVDIFEKLPVPFGLVRFGVAPDHSDLKKCINSFTKTAELQNVRFFGNINLGKDVSFQNLKEAYHMVLLAYGVDDSQKFNIKGSNLKNIFQAKDFVGWYNGHPYNKNLDIDLSGPSAAIFGHGNVAIDVARILLSPIDKLKTTDITEHSLSKLANSKVKEVFLIGRRGPLQVSFTIKELRELLTLQNCCDIWRHNDMRGVPQTVALLKPPRKRLTQLIIDKFEKRLPPEPNEKRLKMIFLRSPKEFEGDVIVKNVKLGVNVLEGVDFLNKKAILTGLEETIDTNLVVTSIGYKSIQADPDIPFDKQRGTVQHSDCEVESGVYTAGWLAKGASGVLSHTMQHAFSVGNVISKKLETVLDKEKPGFEHIKKIIDDKNVQVVSWKDWLKIDEFEKKEGKKVNKPREKIVDTEQMLKIAAS